MEIKKVLKFVFLLYFSFFISVQNQAIFGFNQIYAKNSVDKVDKVDKECISPAPIMFRVFLAIPYIIFSIPYYIIGFVVYILCGILTLIVFFLHIPAAVLDLLIFYWSTGEWLLLNLVNKLMVVSEMAEKYTQFGVDIHDSLWGSCD